MHVYRVVDGVACVFVICVRVVRGISALRDARGTYGFSQFDPNSFEICGMTARILLIIFESSGRKAVHEHVDVRGDGGMDGGRCKV